MIWVKKVYYNADLYGYTDTTTDLPATPNETNYCEVYYGRIDEDGPPTTKLTDNDNDNDVDNDDVAIARDTQDDADLRETEKTIAHEVGHALHVDHYPYDSNNPNHLTVMIYYDFLDDMGDWSNIPSTYDNTDRGQIRVH